MFRLMRFALLLSIAYGMIANARQDQPRVVKINDSIYMAPLGANVYLVTTPAGNGIDAHGAGRGFLLMPAINRARISTRS